MSELYQHYAVMFAALLKPMSDLDYHERVDIWNHDVEDIASLVHEFEALAKDKGSVEQLGAAIQHLEDDSLRQALVPSCISRNSGKKTTSKPPSGCLRSRSRRMTSASPPSTRRTWIMRWRSWPSSRNPNRCLKNLAGQGMNLVGEFVEAAMAATRREMGR